MSVLSVLRRFAVNSVLVSAIAVTYYIYHAGSVVRVNAPFVVIKILYNINEDVSVHQNIK
jgi:hypothetical protein